MKGKTKMSLASLTILAIGAGTSIWGSLPSKMYQVTFPTGKQCEFYRGHNGRSKEPTLVFDPQKREDRLTNKNAYQIAGNVEELGLTINKEYSITAQNHNIPWIKPDKVVMATLCNSN